MQLRETSRVEALECLQEHSEEFDFILRVVDNKSFQANFLKLFILQLKSSYQITFFVLILCF